MLFRKLALSNAEHLRLHIGPKFAGARNDCRIQCSSRTIEVRQRLAEVTAAVDLENCIMRMATGFKPALS